MVARVRNTLLWSGALALAVGLVKPAPYDPLISATTEERRFYLLKTHGTAKYDMVILGDSRTLRGVSPTAMAEFLPGTRILNFAYNSGGLNRVMFEAAESRLDPTSRRRAIGLGVTPLALLNDDERNVQFEELRSARVDALWASFHFPAVLEFFEPIKPSVLVNRLLRSAPKERHDQVFHDDGWIRSSRVPVLPEESLGVYRRRLTGRHVDPRLVAGLLAQTRAWTAEGIDVFLFRPPTTDALMALENDLATFDLTALARDFERAGGFWIEVPNDGYETYDGSHLIGDSAERFSWFLGKAIVARQLPEPFRDSGEG